MALVPSDIQSWEAIKRKAADEGMDVRFGGDGQFHLVLGDRSAPENEPFCTPDSDHLLTAIMAYRWLKKIGRAT